MSRSDELRARQALKCKHFSGLGKGECDHGVHYDLIRQRQRTDTAPYYRYRYACLTLSGHEQVGGCDYYEPYTKEELDAKYAKYQHFLDCMNRGISHCCEAPIDESQVIQEGTYKGHGKRFCSKCGKMLFMV